ncbi:MAG: FtsW/RodA/SpoVE family cell cycle protein [Lachnospiraceae bacterium]|nr:FtsW/RodA/SpoVE family cell cycle protein [Lachnospiraceae bacterium]
MEEYIKVLLEQIRCRKVHPYIAEELKSHMEDQISDNLALGMTGEEAEAAAVEDMGSPVEAGVALDQIHRPQIAWDLIGVMAAISLAGIIIHLFIGGDRQSVFFLHTVIGFGMMLIVYRIDYTMIGKYAKIIGGGILLLCVYGLFRGIIVSGTVLNVRLLNMQFSLFPFMMLYVPVYGAILYRYHGSGYGGFGKALLWLVAPIAIVWHFPNLGLALMMLVSMAAVLTVALCKDWFKISKGLGIAGLWLFIIGLPALGLTCGYVFNWLNSYQKARLHAFFTHGDVEDYRTNILRTGIASSRFMGGDRQTALRAQLAYDSDFILNYVISGYGFIVGALVCCLLAFLILKVFSVTFRQKNQLGLAMSCGSSMVLLVNIGMNLLVNLGLLPVTQSFLPFFSVGGSSIITSYILVGIIMSVYRYKNIYPERVRMKLKTE